MKKILYTTLLLFAGLSVVQAQVPGYMGKTCMIQVGMSGFPSFLKPVNVVQSSDYKIIYGMNWKPTLGMDFMISRKSSIGFNMFYFSTAEFERDPNYLLGEDKYQLGIDGGGVGFVFKTHFGNWVAPLGPYYRLEVGAFFYGVTRYPVPPGVTPSFLPYYVEPFSGGGYISNGIGRTHIFANVFSLDYGFEIGIVVPPVLQSTVHDRVFFHFLGNGYIKLGAVF